MPTVVCTLWPVEDLAAALFAVRFYQEHLGAGKAPARATADARRWLREATAEDVLDAVYDLQDCLELQDDEANQALCVRSAQLKGLDPEVTPFSGVEHWGPFAVVGRG